jgi:hypothetical protein
VTCKYCGTEIADTPIVALIIIIVVLAVLAAWLLGVDLSPLLDAF